MQFTLTKPPQAKAEPAVVQSISLMATYKPRLYARGHVWHRQRYARDIHAIGAEIILGNTFHLWLRPTTAVIDKFNGLHDFIGWNKPILTDSGGFQVFSLGAMRKIKEEGVYFRSPIDGAKVFLSPEISMQTKIAQLRHRHAVWRVHPYPATPLEADKSLELSLRWGERCKNEHAKSRIPMPYLVLFKAVCIRIYGKNRLAGLLQLDFDGYAIGGLSGWWTQRRNAFGVKLFT